MRKCPALIENVFVNKDEEPEDPAKAIGRYSDMLGPNIINRLHDTTGSEGSFLSGGEKQKIALTRALCHKRKILILDEAASNLDSASHQKMLELVLNSTDFDIVFVVTHDHEELSRYDKIGSTMPSDASLLYPLCEALISDGTIIIAATSNDNVFTFPASFENVIAVRYRHNNDAPITVCTRDFLGTNFSVSYNRSELARLTGVDTLPSNSFAVPVIAAEIINGYFQFSSLSASDIIRILMKINKYPHCDSSYSSSPIYESERPLIIKISSKKIIQHIPRIIKVLKHKYDLEAICLTPKTNDIAHQFYCVPKKDIDTFFTNKLYAHIRSDILFIIEMEYEKYDIEINLQASTVFFTIAEGLYKHQYNITPNILEEMIADKIILLNRLYGEQ